MFTVIQEHSEEQDLVILAHCHNYAFLSVHSNVIYRKSGHIYLIVKLPKKEIYIFFF